MLPGMNEGAWMIADRILNRWRITIQFWIGFLKLLLAFTVETEYCICALGSTVSTSSMNFLIFPHYCKCLGSIIKNFKKVNVFRTIIYLSSNNIQLIIFSLKICFVISSYTNRLPLRLASIIFKPWTLQRNPTFIKFWHGLNFFWYCELSLPDNNFVLTCITKL